MYPQKIKVLVVDDEPKIRLFIRANLEARGYEVHLAQNGLEGLEKAHQVSPDIIVMDVNMPKLDGIEACRRIRQWSDTPIIVLSVREDQTDKVKALDQGADDYVTKPFGMDELLARIRVALRHATRPSAGSAVFSAADLEVDLSQRLVQKRGKKVPLTRTEYELLAYLVSNCGKLVTHKDLLVNVWGPEYGVENEYVRLFIWQLRRKIEDDPSRPVFIITEPRTGYRLVKPRPKS
ncbi:MAG: response regulator transcription factor [Chloroflexi bacterium]|nr:response regulator transcription factor [Chloroflexota bacterium]